MKQQKSTLRTLFFSATAIVALAATGCQSSIGGQTLPSPHYIYDDINYAPTGPDFKLSQEAAQLEAYSADQRELNAKRPSRTRFK